jgi:hypothetical protein
MDDRLDNLLELWQTEYERGRDIPPHELCRDCPELLTEVKSRIAKLKATWKIMSPPSDSTSQETVDRDRPSSWSGATHGEDVATADQFTYLTPPESADELGWLGSYRVLRVLGRGGMGLVFAAEEVELRRPATSGKKDHFQRLVRPRDIGNHEPP